MGRRVYEYRVDKVHRIVDGDTYDLYVDLGFRQFGAYRFRLLDIDTPELYRPRNKEEKDAAQQAADYVREWFGVHLANDHEILCRTMKEDSFGRWLADFLAYDEKRSLWSDLATELTDRGFDWSGR